MKKTEQYQSNTKHVARHILLPNSENIKTSENMRNMQGNNEENVTSQSNTKNAAPHILLPIPEKNMKTHGKHKEDTMKTRNT